MSGFKPTRKSDGNKAEFDSYFKIGVSDEFILIRRDFPMKTISPADFSKLLKMMFDRNDEALRNGK